MKHLKERDKIPEQFIIRNEKGILCALKKI
jgi:hypothetical protein